VGQYRLDAVRTMQVEAWLHPGKERAF